MMQKIWNALRVATPLSLITFGFSFSQIPDFLVSTEVRALLAQFITQIAIGVTDALIDLAIMSVFDLV